MTDSNNVPREISPAQAAKQAGVTIVSRDLKAEAIEAQRVEEQASAALVRPKRSAVPTSSHAVRKAARERASNVLQVLEDVATGAIADVASVHLQCPKCETWSRHKVEVASPADRVRAVIGLAQIGIPSQSEVIVNEEVRDKLRETVATLERMLPAGVREAVLSELDGIWSE